MNTPIRLISLTLRNFLSYGNNYTTINLEFDQPTLIVGRNLDAMVEGKVDSNGSGKTTLVNALVWCLYDKPLSKISKDGLINNINKKNMEVTVLFEKNGKFYKIVRFRKHKVLGGDGIKIYEADKLSDLTKKGSKVVEKAYSSIAESNQQLARIIDMPYDIFIRTIIYSARHDPFFELPVTSASGPNQTDIMENLTGLTELSYWGDDLSENIKANNRQIETLKRVQEEIDRQKSQYSEKLNSIKARADQWDSVKLTNISNTKAKLDALSEVDFEFQKECLEQYSAKQDKLKETTTSISLKNLEVSNLEDKLGSAERWEEDHQGKLSKAKASLDALDVVDYESERNLLESITERRSLNDLVMKQINENAQRIAVLNRSMSEIADQLEHLEDNNCPYCRQQFKDSRTKINELELEKGALYTECEKLLAENRKLSDKYEREKQALDDLAKTAKFTTPAELANHEGKRNLLENEVTRLSATENPHAGIDLEELKGSIDGLTGQIAKLEKTKVKLASTVDVIKGELLYLNLTDLLNDSHKIEVLKDELVRLQEGENPHLETLEDMKNMKFDEDNYKKIEELESEIVHQKFLHKLLTKKDSFIRKSLLSKSLKFLNERLKGYMDMMGMSHKVKFTESLSASISQFGNTLDFGNLSAGQQARVNLSVSFAFRDLLQKRYGKINFWVLDECLDVGLGSVGVQMAAKMVKAIAVKDKLSMFVISHRDEVHNLFPNVLEIELSKGFSTVLKSKLSKTEEMDEVE